MHKSTGKLLLAAALAVAMSATFAPISYANPDDTAVDTSTEAAPCTANKAMSQKTLGKFHAYVINVDTGEVLVDVLGKELTPSASVIKTLTAVAALQKLPPEYRAVTQVLATPSEPSTLVLKGGGDFTLSRLGPGESSVYSKPPRIRNLAKEALEKIPVDVPITKIILDDSFFSGERWNPDWPAKYRTLGYVSNITAIQADGDRVQPNRLISSYSFRRGKDPVITVGEALRASLGERAANAELVVGKTPADAYVVSEVQSQDMRLSWLGHMLTHSDNTAAEFIARHAAKVAGLEGSIAGANKVVKQSLRQLGLKPKPLVIRDASGLSGENRVHSKLLAELMVKVAKAENGLGVLTEWMPIAGETGTLRYRFQGKSAIARGNVIAKTGYIPGLYGLSGIVNASDGSRLAFAVFARADSENGISVTYTAQGAIDRVVTRFYSCGASLTQ
jgi:D-alanyl-D-alanine carboxypeptidase/D-alanyl-D-alanine-endopeptidase (penicillin-binding protein 4)